MNGMATVLIVEDEFAIADLLKMALTDEGYCVLTAANGRQGLTRLSRLPNVLRQRPEPEFVGRHARLPACL